MHFVDLFCPVGAMRHTAKSNLLNEIEIKKCSLPSLVGNPDLGETITNFMITLQSTYYSKFEKCSNVAEELSTKPFLSFLECNAGCSS